MTSSKFLASLTAILATALAAAAGCQKPNQFVPPPPPKVTVAHPVEQQVTDTIEFVGTTEPTQMVVMRARVNGYLEKIFYKDGAEVQAGQELFLIEQAPYQVVLDAAQAANQKAIAALGLAQSQYRRMEPLLKNGVVTQEELDVQAAQVASSKADVEAAEAAVRKAQLDLAYTRVIAPISGRVARHMVDIGNLVRAEETELAIIRVIDPIYAIFDVSETDYLRFSAMLRSGELPNPETNPPILRLALGNEDGFPHEGRLDYREMVVGTQTGTIRRRAIFPNPGLQIIPGMQVRIQANIGEPKSHLLVDERAIGSDQRGDYVLVVNAKNVVEYRSVKLGSHVGDMRVIDSGVNADDRVVVNGLQRARPGAEVNPEDAKAPASEAVAKTDTTATTPASAAAPQPPPGNPVAPEQSAKSNEQNPNEPPPAPPVQSAANPGNSTDAK